MTVSAKTETSTADPSTLRSFVALWLGTAVVFVAFAAGLVITSDRYDWALRLADLPMVTFALALSGAGVVFLGVVALSFATVRNGLGNERRIVFVILGCGLLMRALMIPSTPVLEDDFYRYLWDGAVTANGLNPFATAPGDALGGGAGPTLTTLAAEGRGVLERVNHPHLKTIYPPVAQGAFAAAYLIEPWSLRAWRVVCLIGELGTLGIGLWLLATLGQPLVWIALYWLNPLVVKVLMNSAHMEAIVLPFVMAAVLLLAWRRPVWATVALGFAIGAKVWPAVLVPLVLRPLLAHPARLIGALAILGGMGVCWVLPPLLGGMDETSGFVAYASYWQTNSALFPSILESHAGGPGVGGLASGMGWNGQPGRGGRARRGRGIVGLLAPAWRCPRQGGESRDRRRCPIPAQPGAISLVCDVGAGFPPILIPDGPFGCHCAPAALLSLLLFRRAWRPRSVGALAGVDTVGADLATSGRRCLLGLAAAACHRYWPTGCGRRRLKLERFRNRWNQFCFKRRADPPGGRRRAYRGYGQAVRRTQSRVFPTLQTKLAKSETSDFVGGAPFETRRAGRIWSDRRRRLSRP